MYTGPEKVVLKCGLDRDYLGMHHLLISLSDEISLSFHQYRLLLLFPFMRSVSLSLSSIWGAGSLQSFLNFSIHGMEHLQGPVRSD
jgi:hypothetical protein